MPSICLPHVPQPSSLQRHSQETNTALQVQAAPGLQQCPLYYKSGIACLTFFLFTNSSVSSCDLKPLEDFVSESFLRLFIVKSLEHPS
jgi:hypothetical protein